MANLQFVPFSSSLDSGFWHILGRKKLEEYGLSEEPIELSGIYNANNASGVPSLFHVDYSSFNVEEKSQLDTYRVKGFLLNTNTIDQFKMCDKSHLLRNAGAKIWAAIMSGEAIGNPQSLVQFLLITFANLKKYQYHYWFGFPALNPLEPVTLLSEPVTISDKLSAKQIEEFLVQYDKKMRPQSIPFFALRKSQVGVEVQYLAEVGEDIGDVTFVFCDPSTMAKHPGWPLRNLLCLISKHFIKKANTTVTLLGLRDRTRNSVREVSHSIYLEVTLSPLSTSEMWNVVGWERNKQQKLSPRFVNMSRTMDPEKLAESAVDLNLKLMRWRLLPELDLETISQTKCLLLGAGTLGCNVARNLLGWGVRNITLVDNSTVSFSNPVRQSLFTFDHCMGGGQPKAETAAESLKLIFPGVNARGLSLAIPMPGHSVSDSLVETVRKDVELLESLIEEHDAVFLLMDTRESRWLPTVVGAAKGKIVLTAALGFDSWLAMRHGGRSNSQEPQGDNSMMSKVIPGDKLGCYYCNDVVAPRDSTKDRTLDQQCTVSRPGLSMLCSALVVELLMSVLQHPNRFLASATIGPDEDDDVEQSILGIVPHQIRGFLSRYQLILPVSQRFTNCTACSDLIVHRYEEEGFEFLLRAFNEPNYLEEISGLLELHADPLGTEVMSDFDDGEDDW